MRTTSLFVFGLAAACHAPEPQGSRGAPLEFPAAWSGTWRGELEALDAQGAKPIATVELVIAPTDDPRRWTWRTTYDGSAGRVVKDFALLERDASRGEFALDEGGGVELEARYFGGVLHTWFDVGESRITAREAVVAAGTDDERFTFELLSAPNGPIATLASGTITSFAPTLVQRALLERVR
ncbi:MAG: hypothetical protein L6Q99_15350 [Planctomycetes bacterium]|nr:hypothetical protein [Planctomycetota bacterium]